MQTIYHCKDNGLSRMLPAATTGADGVEQLSRSDTALVALRRILRATEMHSRNLARASGLTTAQLLALQAVGGTGRSTPKEMAAGLNVSQATMTALLDRLEEKHLVRRERSQTDRRQTNIWLTGAGREALDRAPDPLQDQFRAGFERLEDWEQAMIIAALEKIAALLNARGIDASPVLDLGDIRGPARG